MLNSLYYTSTPLQHLWSVSLHNIIIKGWNSFTHRCCFGLASCKFPAWRQIGRRCFDLQQHPWILASLAYRLSLNWQEKFQIWTKSQIWWLWLWLVFLPSTVTGHLRVSGITCCRWGVLEFLTLRQLNNQYIK